MKAAINSTHLKGTYIRDLKNVAAFFSAAWKEETRKRSRERRVEKETRDESTYARVALLEEENATLRRELAAERAARTRKSSGRSDQQRKSRDRDRKKEALEKGMEELGPQIARDILEQLTGQKFNHSQKAGRKQPAAEIPVRTTAPPPVRQEERGWTVIMPRRTRRKKGITTATATTTGETQRNERSMAMPTRSVNLPKTNGTRREGRRAQGQVVVLW
jgi:hypothetical protein